MTQNESPGTDAADETRPRRARRATLFALLAALCACRDQSAQQGFTVTVIYTAIALDHACTERGLVAFRGRASVRSDPAAPNTWQVALDVPRYEGSSETVALEVRGEGRIRGRTDEGAPHRLYFDATLDAARAPAVGLSAAVARDVATAANAVREACRPGASPAVSSWRAQCERRGGATLPCPLPVGGGG